jgi:hypothetical protein
VCCIRFKCKACIRTASKAVRLPAPLNIDEFETDDKLIVEQMIEPLIMKDGTIRKQAIINLVKVEQ